MTSTEIKLEKFSTMAEARGRSGLPFPLLDQLAAVPDDGAEYKLMGRHKNGLWGYSSGHSTKSNINRAAGDVPAGFEVRLISDLPGEKTKSSKDRTKLVMLLVRRVRTCPTCHQQIVPMESK